MGDGETILLMKSWGTSVTLNWGEDNGLWECSFVLCGVRYSGVSATLESAVREVWQKSAEAHREAERM